MEHDQRELDPAELGLDEVLGGLLDDEPGALHLPVRRLIERWPKPTAHLLMLTAAEMLLERWTRDEPAIDWLDDRQRQLPREIYELGWRLLAGDSPPTDADAMRVDGNEMLDALQDEALEPTVPEGMLDIVIAISGRPVGGGTVTTSGFFTVGVLCLLARCNADDAEARIGEWWQRFTRRVAIRDATTAIVTPAALPPLPRFVDDPRHAARVEHWLQLTDAERTAAIARHRSQLAAPFASPNGRG